MNEHEREEIDELLNSWNDRLQMMDDDGLAADHVAYCIYELEQMIEAWDLSPVNVRERRKKSGMTQRDLADAVGVSTQTIRNWEQGKVTMKPHNKRKLKEVFEGDER